MYKYNYKKKKYNIINTCGLRCPEPLIIIKTKFRYINYGEKIFFITDDINTKKDIIRFCIFMKHTILKIINKKNYYIFFLQKKKKM